MTREVVVIDGARTAVGTFGGSLKDFAPTKLASDIVREVVSRAGVD
ncbi:MAG: acetyl-CoA C-acyltransferase, partial [Betaproteobacteria bacterium]|nr:acetyl-CoA C-acyltransferase [Betaproteobacteria bacterium]